MTERTDQTQLSHLPSHGGEQIINVNGVDLCVETFGNPGDPAILLIHGAATPMHGWEDEFCERLAGGGRFVIRYDQRDTGQSVSYPPGEPGYGMYDLIDDSVGILDVLDLEHAHVTGISMGGGIALGAALRYPERVASLTLIATSPGGADLPPMSKDFLTFSDRYGPPDWSARDSVIDYVIELMRVCAGSADALDPNDLRARLGHDFDRTTNIESSLTNHFMMKTGTGRRDRLGEIAIPALVIHGEEDPIFPIGHAETMVREIPGGELLVLEQSGHLLTSAVWDIVVPAMLAHTSGDPTDSRIRDAAD